MNHGKKRYWYTAMAVATFHFFYAAMNIGLTFAVVFLAAEGNFELVGMIGHLLLASMFLMLVANLFFEKCPLTIAENFFRSLFNTDTVYEETFAVHLANKMGFGVSPSKVKLLAFIFFFISIGATAQYYA